MKQFKPIAMLSLLLATALIISSCKKDEEPSQTTEQTPDFEQFDFTISWTQKSDGTYKGRSYGFDQHLKPTDSYRNLIIKVSTIQESWGGGESSIPGRMYYRGDKTYGNYGWNFDYEIDNGSVVFEATCFGEAETVTIGGTTYRAPQEWPQRPSSLLKFRATIIR